MLGLLLCIFSLLWRAGGQNWGQLSGSNVQNVVNADEHPPFPPMWGFASVVVQQVPLIGVTPPTTGTGTTTSSTATSGGTTGARSAQQASPSPSPGVVLSSPSKLLVMGGDSWRGDLTTAGKSAEPWSGVSDKAVGGSLGGTPNGPGQDFLGNPILPNAVRVGPDAGGYGGLSNDVFSTDGASWRVYTDYRQTNPFGEPTPIIVSNISWNATPGWLGFPKAYTNWKDYLGCCHATHPFPCSSNPPPCNVQADGSTQDNILEQRRWSPRRGASATVVIYTGSLDPPMVILSGGRAVSFSSMDPADLHGGALFSDTDTLRSPTWLMNDVWVTTDYGVTWDFANAGCWVNDQYSVLFPGPSTYKCKVDSDCFTLGLGGDTACWFGPNVLVPTPASIGTCVCKHWSPREHHASTVSWLTGTPVMYVTGGISFTSEQMCGQWACGKGTAKFNTDSWASYNQGTTWALLTANLMPEEVGGRADHAMLYASNLLYFLGGVGRSDGDRGVEALFSTMYTSQVGLQWRMSNIPPLYGQRAEFGSATDGNRLMMFGGVVPLADKPAAPPLLAPAAVESAASLVGGGGGGASTTSSLATYNTARSNAPGELIAGLQRYVTNDFFSLFLNDLGTTASNFMGAAKNQWYQDWANPGFPVQNQYIYPQWPLTSQLDLLNVSASDAAVLASALGIVDAQGLAMIPYSSVKLCQDTNQLNIPNICAYKRAAQQLVNFCTPRFRPWVTWASTLAFFTGIWPVQYSFPLPTISPDGWLGGWDPSPEDDGCFTAQGGSLPINPYTSGRWGSSNYVCRTVPPPRSHGALAVMDGKTYVMGGWLAPGVFTNDLWVRDEVLPVTSWVHPPETGGGKDRATDTTLTVACSEPGCIFEARFWDGSPSQTGAFSDGMVLLRDWTLIPATYQTLGINGANRATTVQVRAIDAAGNKDPRPIFATWTYVPPFPTGSIILAVLGVLVLLILAYWYYRRWWRRRMLEWLARRKLQRAANEKERERRRWKRVKKFRKEKQVKKTRDRAHNNIIEEQATLRNKFRELLEVRAMRDRESRLKLAERPLEPLAVTTLAPPKPPITRNVMKPAILMRDAKDALDFNPEVLGAKTATEMKKLERTHAMAIMAQSKGVSVSGLGMRDGAAADMFRAGLGVHSDAISANAMAGITVDKIPTTLARKSAIKEARKAGRKEEDAWEISHMQSALTAQETARKGGKGEKKK